MPQHASAKKRVRTNERDRLKNRTVKSQVRGAVKKLRTAIGEEEAPVALRQAHSVLDNATRKGVMHRKTVDRMKSRLAKAVNRGAAE
jgi:small subunit ribosomal protein S20